MRLASAGPASAVAAIPNGRRTAASGRMRMWFLERTTRDDDLFCRHSRRRSFPSVSADLSRLDLLDRRVLDPITNQECIRGLLPDHNAADPRVTTVEVRCARVHDEPLRTTTVLASIGDTYTADHVARTVKSA